MELYVIQLWRSIGGTKELSGFCSLLFAPGLGNIVTKGAHESSKIDLKIDFFYENSLGNDIQRSNPVLTLCPASESENPRVTLIESVMIYKDCNYCNYNIIG